MSRARSRGSARWSRSSLPAPDASDARFAAAFAAVAHVHRTMSAHDSRSDLARIARDAHRRAVVVDPGTHAVLELALRLYRRRRAAPSTSRSRRCWPAPACCRRARRHRKRGRPDGCACAPARTTACARRGRSRSTCPASPRATRSIAPLTRCAEPARPAGIVNAGGDLRVFGADAWMPIRVRHPTAPALACISSISAMRPRRHRPTISAARRGGLVDPRTRRAAALSGQRHRRRADLRAGRRADQDRRAGPATRRRPCSRATARMPSGSAPVGTSAMC